MNRDADARSRRTPSARSIRVRSVRRRRGHPRHAPRGLNDRRHRVRANRCQRVHRLSRDPRCRALPACRRAAPHPVRVLRRREPPMFPWIPRGARHPIVHRLRVCCHCFRAGPAPGNRREARVGACLWSWSWTTEDTRSCPPARTAAQVSGHATRDRSANARPIAGRTPPRHAVFISAMVYTARARSSTSAGWEDVIAPPFAEGDERRGTARRSMDLAAIGEPIGRRREAHFLTMSSALRRDRPRRRPQRAQRAQRGDGGGSRGG